MKLHLKLFLIFTLFVCGCGKNESDEKPIVVEKNIPPFLFVANYEGLPAIYKFIPEKDTAEVAWFNRSERVIELIVPDNGSSAFFLTATSSGKAGLFPFINNLKLYSLNNEGNPVFLKDFGNVLLAIANLTSESTLRIITNTVDRTGVIYINQNEKIFNEFGKVMSDKSTRFNLAKDGFPRTPLKYLSLNSRNSNFSVSLGDSVRQTLEVKYANKKVYHFNSRQEVSSIKWFEEDSLLIFSTLDISPSNSTLDSPDPETAALYIFSYKDKKIIKEWKGSGLKNFRLTGEYLIFDEGFSAKSLIRVYNLKTQKEKRIIQYKNGCGIKKIPTKPDYDA